MKPKLSVKVSAAVEILAVESIESVMIYHERRKKVNPIKKADKKGLCLKHGVISFMHLGSKSTPEFSQLVVCPSTLKHNKHALKGVGKERREGGPCSYSLEH